MKNIMLFEQFINDGKHDMIIVELSNNYNINHTRIVKWMSANMSTNEYDIELEGSTLTINTKNISAEDFEDLHNYLDSQKYGKIIIK